MEEQYTIKEICKILKMDRTKLYRMREKNQIHVAKIGGDYRVSQSELDRLLKPIN